MNTDAALVELAHVTKRFGSFVALDDVSLTVGHGEFLSLLGPSGCGKSTLLRLIAGLESPDDGALRIEGRDMAKVPAYRRPCNMVFQNYAIFPHLDVRANVAYGLRSLDLGTREKEDRIDEMLAAVRLQGFGERKPHQLSGGQRQRVALARALVRRPKVLLLDEPLGALDKTLREQMQHELRELQRSVGITFILVTHDQDEALSMSDRIAVVSAGRILQTGTPVEIYERPNCSMVASFIGDMNFIPAATVQTSPDGGAVVMATGFGRIELSDALPGDAPGLRHRVAVRPEKLSLEPPDGDCLTAAGTVVSASYWGDQSQFQVRLDDDDTLVTVASPNRSTASGQPAAAERVRLTARRGDFLRFQEETDE